MKLVAFPFHDWRKGQTEGFRTRDLHLLQTIAANRAIESVLVVDRPVSLAERLARRQPWSVAGDTVEETSIGGATARLTRTVANVVVLDQAVGDVVQPVLNRRSWWFDIFDRPRTSAAVDWGIEQALGRADGALVWLPAVESVVLGSGLPFVYDSLDNWLIHPAFVGQRARSERAYANLLPAAAAVFASAPASRNALERWRNDIEILPNGVDPETFAGSFPRPTDLPSGPIVGYAGKLAERIDAELVAAVARAVPEVAFVFLGPVLQPSAIAAMRGIPNVLLLGDRTYDRLPAYLKHFDIGWIPHRVGAGETGGDPIKLYEYWAAGLTVVSTPIDGWDAWGPSVAIVRDATQATETLRAILSGSIHLPPMAVPPGRTWKAIGGSLLRPLLD